MAVVRVENPHAAHLQGAGQREDVADVIVHDKYGRAGQRVGLVQARRRRRAAQLRGQFGEERRAHRVGVRAGAERATYPGARQLEFRRRGCPCATTTDSRPNAGGRRPGNDRRPVSQPPAPCRPAGLGEHDDFLAVSGAGRRKHFGRHHRGDVQREGAAQTDCARDADGSAEQPRKLLADGQPEPGTAVAP